MVFVQKSLAEMVSEANVKDLEQSFLSHTITTSDKRYDWLRLYLRTHQKLLKGHLLDEVDVRNILYPYRRLPLIALMMENCYNRGYDYAQDKPIILDYIFGADGLIMRCKDFGKGFDTQLVIGALESNERTQGIHYRGSGIGLTVLAKDPYQVNIESSRLDPSGTTVTVLYKVQHLQQA